MIQFMDYIKITERGESSRRSKATLLNSLSFICNLRPASNLTHSERSSESSQHQSELTPAEK